VAGWLVEGVTARAGALGVGVVDGEALLVDAVDEVDRRAGEVRHAHPVHHDLDAAELGDLVAFEVALIEEELVAQAGTAAWLNRHSQAQVVAPFLLQ
jgi:hypothetical protein